MRCLHALALGFLSVLPVAHAQGAPDDVVVEKAWSRATPSAGAVGVIYLTIRNKGAAGDRLIGITSPVARLAQVHETRSDPDGMTTMAPLVGIDVPGHGEVEFKPGGLHVMLVDLQSALVFRDRFGVDLTFEHAGMVHATVTVEKAGAKVPDASNGMKM